MNKDKDTIDIDLGKIYDNIKQKGIKKVEGDYLSVATAFDDTVRIFAVRCNEAVYEMQKIHQSYPTSSAALGRTLAVAFMMGAMLKDDQSLAIKIEGNGPIGKICCEVNSSLKAMAYCDNPQVYLQYKNGRLDVKDAVGTEGTLTVTKDLHLKEPYTSTIELVSGEIAEDFTYYFTESEQCPSSVALGVQIDKDCKCNAAGGFIVQIMPDCKEETIQKLEENLEKLDPVSNMLESGLSLREIIKLIVGTDEFTVRNTRPVKFGCSCSKEKYTFGLKSLGYKTIKKLRDEDHGVEAKCNYCHKVYEFSEEELTDILNEMEVH